MSSSNDRDNLAARDAAIIWHPFTQMKTAGLPVPIVRASGVWLYDAEGRAYLDAISSWWVNLHGHAHPYIAAKISEQMQKLEQVIFAGFTHEPAVTLAERLKKILPAGLDRFFYSDNGSTAIEVAVKMAIQYWHNQGLRKSTIIALENSYHGDTFGAMSVGSRSIFSAPFDDYLFEVKFIAAPLPGQEQKSQQQLSELLEKNDAALFIYEPLVQGAGGMKMYRPEALEPLLALCRQAGVLLLADEVMTGFGRTGRLFASEHMATRPDLMALSKAITGGFLPMGLTVCREQIFGQFWSDDKSRTFFHGHSYTANPLACAAALASLDLLEQPGFLPALQAIEKSHRQFASQIASHPLARNLRVQGTILALEIGEGGYLGQTSAALHAFFLGRGVLLRPLGNTIYILPPASIQSDELAVVYDSIVAALQHFQSE